MTQRPADNSPTPSGPSPAAALPSTKPYVRALEARDSTPSTSDQASLPGLENYELLGEIARGGMGVVYRAKQVGIDRVVALKTLRGDALNHPQAIERFEREMRATARLQHPNIVPIFDVGRGQPYYTMAYMPGGALSKQRERYQDARAAAGLVEKIARAVGHAHEQGVVHRDLKPSNILLDERGEPLVGDFGLAKFLDSDIELTRTGAVLGTPAYMAPEQAAGRSRDVGPASDIWALGVILYELVVGRRPFEGDGGDEVKRRIMDEEPTRPSSVREDIDAGLESIVLSCLQKEPSNRYASAEALADDLQHYLRGESPANRPRRRRRIPIGLAVAACVGLVVAITLYFIRDPEDIEPKRPEVKLDPPIVLIGDTGPPKEFKWLEGEKSVVKRKQREDEPFAIESKELCLLQLLEKPPWKRFRLEAEVKHAKETDGMAGIFIGHTNEPANKPDAIHYFWTTYARAAGKIDWAFGRYRPHPLLHFAQEAHASKLVQPFDEFGAPLWQQISVEVVSNRVRGFWKDYQFADFTIEMMQREFSASTANVGNNSILSISDKVIGLYLNRGKAEFRKVIVREISM